MGYDFCNRLTCVGGYADIGYTVLGGVDAVVYGNGVSTGYTYDTRNRPENIVTQNSIEPLLNLTYTYDKTGSITQIYESVENATEAYGYDLLDRLVWGNGSWGDIGYSYDPVGNRLSKSSGGSAITYSYDCMDRITSATGMGFDWDDNGNMVYKDDGAYAWNYTYDTLNRLTAVHKDGDLSALYTYDAGGRRVRSWENITGGVTTDYMYSGLNVIDEINSGVHERHIYSGGMHIASNTTGSVEYYHVDHLGSTRLKTAANGSAIYESNYEPFGPSSGESGSEDYRYTGKQEDTTGLYYYGARYYDPDVGRFITRDTFPGYRRNPQSLNKYIYCLNNPHKYNDPTGNQFEYVDDLTTIVATLYFMYVAAPQLERLFTNLQSLGAVTLAPSPTSTASDGIEQYREQAWNNYGAYQGTSNPTTILEQTQNNGITNQKNKEDKIRFPENNAKRSNLKHDNSNPRQRIRRAEKLANSPGGGTVLSSPYYENGQCIPGYHHKYDMKTNEWVLIYGNKIISYFNPSKGIEYFKQYAAPSTPIP